jgi:transcriptional regulator with XRE-family HTH domain
MASVEPHGEKLRHLRRALGWTQLELALRAGVAERTVRSAERGRPVRREFLDYLAGALGVELPELAREPGALAGFVCWRRNAQAVNDGVTRLCWDGDAGPLVEMLHPKFEIEYHDRAPHELNMAGMAGVFQGTSDIQRSIDNALEFRSRIIERRTIAHPPVGYGNVVIVRASDEFTASNGYRESTWTVQAYYFEDKRIVRADHYSGSSDLDVVAGRTEQSHVSSRTLKTWDSPRVCDGCSL